MYYILIYHFTEEKEKKKAERKERERKQREQNKHMYKLSQDAVKIARERHAKGIMHPWIYQILTQVWNIEAWFNTWR